MSRGQVINGGIVAVAILSSGMTWLGNYVLNSPAQSAQAIASIQSDVSNLKAFKDSQVETNRQLLEVVNRLNNNVVKLLVANHLQPSDN